MKAKRGLTLLEVLLGVSLIAIALFVVITTVNREVIHNRRVRCQRNLNLLTKGMTTYIGEHDGGIYFQCPLGRGRTPNDYNGAEWLACLYWTGVIPDPDIFLCPASGDTNTNGRDIGDGRAGATFGSQTVSYAGMHWRSLTATGSPVRTSIMPQEPLASDDTQGAINHCWRRHVGMNVLFADGHTEFREANELDPEHAVGQKDGLLWRLRN